MRKMNRRDAEPRSVTPDVRRGHLRPVAHGGTHNVLCGSGQKSYAMGRLRGLRLPALESALALSAPSSRRGLQKLRNIELTQRGLDLRHVTWHSQDANTVRFLVRNVKQLVSWHDFVCRIIQWDNKGRRLAVRKNKRSLLPITKVKQRLLVRAEVAA